MTTRAERGGPSTEPVRNIAVSLSGGGYRASSFAAGALLALVDLGLGGRVGSVSSVSGGSIANVLSVGGLKSEPEMSRCAAQIGGLATTDSIRVENRLRFIKEGHVGILLGAAYRCSCCSSS